VLDVARGIPDEHLPLAVVAPQGQDRVRRPLRGLRWKRDRGPGAPSGQSGESDEPQQSV
jgi:hypothetical protein